jgi:hypothetical protein
VRVTPQSGSGEATWLTSRVPIPAVSASKAVAEFSGAYLVGEGRYRVELLLADERDRACYRSWTIDAKLGARTALMRSGLPPGGVDDVLLTRWGRRLPSDPADSGCDVAVLLHAAPMTLGAARLRDGDRLVLMSALVSLLENLPLRNVRLTLFSMDLQKEVYRTRRLTPASFTKAMESLDRLETGLVDFKTLRNPSGHVDLISDLIRREIAANDAPDAVVVLGPLSRWTDSVPRDAFAAYAGAVHYVQLHQSDRRTDSIHTHQPGSEQRVESAGPPTALRPDTLQRAVERLGGRTTEVYGPEEFATAIRETEAALKAGEPRLTP